MPGAGNHRSESLQRAEFDAGDVWSQLDGNIAHDRNVDGCRFRGIGRARRCDAYSGRRRKIGRRGVHAVGVNHAIDGISSGNATGAPRYRSVVGVGYDSYEQLGISECDVFGLRRHAYFDGRRWWRWRGASGRGAL